MNMPVIVYIYLITYIDTKGIYPFDDWYASTAADKKVYSHTGHTGKRTFPFLLGAPQRQGVSSREDIKPWNDFDVATWDSQQWDI